MVSPSKSTLTPPSVTPPSASMIMMASWMSFDEWLKTIVRPSGLTSGSKHAPSEVAVISLANVVNGECVKVAGDDFNVRTHAVTTAADAAELNLDPVRTGLCLVAQDRRLTA